MNDHTFTVEKENDSFVVICEPSQYRIVCRTKELADGWVTYLYDLYNQECSAEDFRDILDDLEESEVDPAEKKQVTDYLKKLVKRAEEKEASTWRQS